MSTSTPEAVKKLVDNMQTDLRSLSMECKKKCPPVKEAAESGIVKIKTIAARNTGILAALKENSSEVVQPFLMGCGTKEPKITQLCLAAIQRLMTHEVVSEAAAGNIINMLWQLMENGLEELKLLQTVLVLLTTNTVAHDEALSKAIVVCFRLHFTKDNITNNTAAATVRQVVTVVFERMVAEDERHKGIIEQPPAVQGNSNRRSSSTLRPCAKDAYMLFQDLCQLVNADAPYWLAGMTEMTRTFGLELLESVLNDFPQVFLQHQEFSFLLKERVCPLVIKLFSPNIKFRQGSNSTSSPAPVEKPYFPICMRLLRVVSVLIKHFYTLLEPSLFAVAKLLETGLVNMDRIEILWRPLTGHLLEVCQHPNSRMREWGAEAVTALIKSGLRYKHEPALSQNQRLQLLLLNPLKELSNIVHADIRQKQLECVLQILQSQGDSLGPGWPLVLGVIGAIRNDQGESLIRTAFQCLQLVVTDFLPTMPCTCLQIVVDVAGSFGLQNQELNISLTSIGLLWNISDHFFQRGETIENELDKEEAILEKQAKEKGVPLNRPFHPAPPFDCLWLCLYATLGELCVDPRPAVRKSAGQTLFSTISAHGTLLQQATWHTVVWKVLTTAVMTDLPVIANILSRLFESSQHLDDVSLHHLINALCSLSMEAMDMAYGNNKEPSLFAVAKLLETGLVNMDRIEILWRPLTGHLLEVCQHPNSRMREWGAEAVTALIKSGLRYKHEPALSQNQRLQLLLLNPLKELSNIVHADIRQKQLECVLQILQSQGDSLGPGWPLVLGVIGAIRNDQGESLIRTAFQCLQLVVTDFLPTMPCTCLQIVVDVAGSFGLQNQELNISLTSIGLLWNISDHFFQRGETIENELDKEEAILEKQAKEKGVPLNRPFHPAPPFDCLWLCLYATLGELCVDPRPAVRKSAGQTLFSTISAHGTLLQQATWHTVVWKQMTGQQHTAVQTSPLISSPDMKEVCPSGNPLGESLIRTAFQCLQLVVTDFLPTMPCTCLQIVVDVAGSFGLQNQELNISLTSIGLLWNISDHFFQRGETIENELDKEEAILEKQAKEKGVPLNRPFHPAPPFDCLWLCLYATLGELCVDPRPAVRKSAGQTLFSTISAHGTLLQQATWHTVVWKVLFHLLDRVRKSSTTADKEKIESGGGNILIHHSRDTAEKQWAETWVLTLAGVARIFNTRRYLLQSLGDFFKAWEVLLGHIQSAALSKNNEVSLAALKSFQEILQIVTPVKDSEKPDALSAVNMPILIDPVTASGPGRPLERTDSLGERLSRYNGAEQIPPPAEIEDSALWWSAWNAWYRIGTDSTKPPTSSEKLAFIPSQPFLTALIQIFPALYQHIKTGFSMDDLKKLGVILHGAVSVPISSDASPFILPSYTEAVLTSLQEAVLTSLDVLQKAICVGPESMQVMYPAIFDQLLLFVEFSCKPPQYGKLETKHVANAKYNQAEWVALNYVPFAEKSLEVVSDLYQKTACHKAVVSEKVLKKIIKTLRMPLSLKYACPSESTWKLAVSSLLKVLSIGLPVARQHASSGKFDTMWPELANAFEDFLFTKSTPPDNLSIQEFQKNEGVDVEVVQLISTEILPFANFIPKEFVGQIMAMLNKGSIHSQSSSFTEAEIDIRMREEFSKVCFETLLQFSFSNKVTTPQEGYISRMALSVLLKRSQDVLHRYVEDERLSGRCPLPRQQVTEIIFVLKAIGTLMDSLKKTQPENDQNGRRLTAESIWTAARRRNYFASEG
ncbi:UNVERIFIED_CONTAM: hypothetical protein FKN15_041044 [Acipenser sinensis]